MEDGQQHFFTSLNGVSRLLDELARGRNMSLDAVRPQLVSMLRETRELAFNLDRDDANESTDVRIMRERLVEQGILLSTRLRKVLLRKEDKEAHTTKAYIKSISLFLLWHQRRKADSDGGGLETRLTAATKAAIELFEHTKEDGEIIACATAACNLWETAVVHDGMLCSREAITRTAFKAYEILICVTLNRVGAGGQTLAQEIARLVSSYLSLIEYNHALSWRASVVASDAGRKLMTRGEHYVLAARCLRAALGALESVLSTSQLPPARMFRSKASILFMLSTCYASTKEPVKALMCLDEILELDESAPPGGLHVPLAKISLQKIKCQLQNPEESIQRAVASVVKLAAMDMETALRGAQAIVGSRNFDASCFSVYEELAGSCQPTDRAAFIRIRLTHIHSLVLSLQLAPTERHDRLLQELTRVATCISQVDGLSDSDRAKAIEMVKRASFLAFKTKETLSWAAKLSGVLSRLAQDPATKEQAICQQAQAMMRAGDDTAVTIAREAYNKNPSQQNRLSYLWIASKSQREEFVLTALKDLLTKELGLVLLESLMKMKQMLTWGPSPDALSYHPRRVLATVMEEWLRVWTEQELKVVAFRHTDDAHGHKKGGRFLTIVTDLLQIVLSQYSATDERSPASDMSFFPSATLAQAAAQDEVCRIMSRYIQPVINKWRSMCPDKSIVGTLASSKAEVKWLSELCWNVGVHKVRSESVKQRQGASSCFTLGYRLASALETSEDSHKILSDEEGKDKILLLLASVSSSIQARLEVDNDETSLPPEELKSWLKELKDAQNKIADMMCKPLSLALAKNLDRTAFIVETLLVLCSSKHSFEGMLRSKDTMRLIQELPIEVIHLIAVHTEKKPWEDKKTATELYRLCLRKCSDVGDTEKALWLYLDLFNCAPDRERLLEVIAEFRQVLDTQHPDEMGVGVAGTVADRFCARTFNEGVCCLEFLDPVAETFISHALSIIPYTCKLFQDEDRKSRMNSAYTVALELRAKEKEERLELAPSSEEKEPQQPPPLQPQPPPPPQQEAPAPTTLEAAACMIIPPPSVTASMALASAPTTTESADPDSTVTMDTSA